MPISKILLSIPKEVSNFIVPFLALFFLAIFFATNAVGSDGLLIVFALIVAYEPELRNRWWKLVWPWLLVILIYFVLMSFHAFSQVTALRDGGEVIKGVSLSLIALYFCQFSDHHLRKVSACVVSVLTLITIVIVVFNLHQHSVKRFLHDQEFDWYVNRNRLAVAFSVTSVYITALMVGEKSRWKTLLWSLFFIVLAIAAILNGSRGAMLGMGAATLCIFLTALLRMGWRQVCRLELWVLPICIVITILSWIIYCHISLNRFFIHDGKGIDTGRFIIWKEVNIRISEAPWFGYGPHAMKFDPMLAPIRNSFDVNHPHSIYLGLIYASGIAGIVFWLIWFATFSNKIKQNFTTKNSLAFYIGIGLLVNILVHGIVDFDLYMYSIFTYITVGLVMMLAGCQHQGSTK